MSYFIAAGVLESLMGDGSEHCLSEATPQPVVWGQGVILVPVVHLCPGRGQLQRLPSPGSTP